MAHKAPLGKGERSQLKMHSLPYWVHVHKEHECNKKVRGYVKTAQEYRQAGRSDLALTCLQIAQYWEDQATKLSALTTGKDEGQCIIRLFK